MSDKNVAGIFSCIILDIRYMVLLCLRKLDGLHNDINNLKFKLKQND
jgi:hypothetical protein